ncbi:MAG: hypothetical protein A2270_02585 [Elusimicrobia bacterium RIFOXYA12_FULL_51_18]|nr:MAG: hypothetical protein A2270_02585 [Elusimicrobia bacterium RIFOXYA12_FULL_51_18]OGS31297.1 MAG: hypothetical protein A2218_08170 [Elusimicrobia bacterium RIFOXYA2_FULL_53_38]
MKIYKLCLASALLPGCISPVVKRFTVFLLILSPLGAMGGQRSLEAPVPLSAEPELVFYDSIETNANGKSVLTGGVYEDAEQATRLRRLRKSLAPVPIDGYYHIRFVADALAMKRANDFSDLLLTNEAFASIRDRFRIEYVEGDADSMNCRNDVPQAPRIISCDMTYILSLGTAPAHMTAVFTSRGSGGAGGSFPVVSLDYPLPTMLHEMLHTWTLNDEYIYSPSEADFYCDYPQILKGPNTSSFVTLETYVSDAEARDRHQADIPWVFDIQSGVPVTVSSTADSGEMNVLKLGTPMELAGAEPGLYPGSNCSRKLPSFRPYGIDTIMKTLSTTWIPPIHQKAVLAAIAKAAGW